MSIFETLNKLSDKEAKLKKNSMQKENTKTKDPSYIYLDENNQVKERKLSELLDSSASALINRTMNCKSLKLIHESIFD